MEDLNLMLKPYPQIPRKLTPTKYNHFTATQKCVAIKKDLCKHLTVHVSVSIHITK